VHAPFTAELYGAHLQFGRTQPLPVAHHSASRDENG